ncbi:MAG: 4-hydroxy-tetrahydrodipicolinate synthase [Acidobacteria bacterium]|nr:4-hydroxy-tetrahydrodipicolinate synthase [Acidobacteriota bacterium]
MSLQNLKGCGTALVTPFQGDGSLDEATLRRLVRSQVAARIDFLVPCGTTGESPTLSAEEHLRVVEITLEEAHGKVPMVPGAGGNNTRAVCERIRSLERMGVDGILSVSPYYNKPTQEGIYQHYRTLAESTPLPILVYNVPGRTGSNVEPKTLARLAEIPNILGVKEASGNVAQVGEIFRLVPESFKVFSGDDALTLPLMALGASGVISVVSNVVPSEMTDLVGSCLRGDFATAQRLNQRLLPLMQVLFVESNPIPVKAALAVLGRIQPNYRLPLVPLHPDNLAKVVKVLEELRLLGDEKGVYAAGGAN